MNLICVGCVSSNYLPSLQMLNKHGCGDNVNIENRVFESFVLIRYKLKYACFKQMYLLQ